MKKSEIVIMITILLSGFVLCHDEFYQLQSGARKGVYFYQEDPTLTHQSFNNIPSRDDDGRKLWILSGCIQD